MKRIEFLDGLRGVAIILVIFFHAFSRWPSIVPYGNSYGNFPLFKYGYLGVQLFFLISGFVILMSLEKSSSFFIFIYKRWLRLFPAMLVATIFIYFTASFLYERPGGQPNIYSVLPGLLFIEPNWIKIITGISINSLEGAFWSLFVEFKFYFIFGASYFILGRDKAILAIFLMYSFSLYFIKEKINIQFLNILADFFSFRYFCWFASGSLAYLFFISKKYKYLFFSILISLIEVFKSRNDLQLVLFYISILFIFYLPIYFEKIRFLFNNRAFLFFGLISYPIYLIHENAMIALICKIHKVVELPYILQPIIPIFILAFISYCIVKTLEPFIRKMIIQISTSPTATTKL